MKQLMLFVETNTKIYRKLLDDTAGRLELKQKSIVRLIKNNQFINKLNKASTVEKESLKPSDATKNQKVYMICLINLIKIRMVS